MDEMLTSLLLGDDRRAAAGPGVKVPSAEIESCDPDTAELKIRIGSNLKSYTLRPLQELYGKGVGKPAVDPEDPDYEPLFLTIEEAIVHHWRSDPELSDQTVLGTLEHLGLKPELEAGDDLLCKHLQFELRMHLSVMDYSRQELRVALRKVAKSVQRHMRVDGPMGYLHFIERYFPE
jgi:hypothetical protein